MLDIDEIVALRNTNRNIINRIKAYPFFVFYGLGYHLEFCYENLVSYFGKPRYIVDRLHGGSSYKGIPVINSLSDIGQEKDYCVVITAPTYVREIVDIAKGYISEDAIMWDVTVFGSTPSNFSDFLVTNKRVIEDFYDELADEESRMVFENWLRGKVSNDVNLFPEICTPNNYMNASFIDELTQKWIGYSSTIPLYLDRTRPSDSYFSTGLFELKEGTAFYDVGTAYGDTIRGFFDYGNVQNGRVVGIELDPEVAKKAQALCDELSYNAQIMNVGLSDKEDTLVFSEGNVGGGSLDVEMAEKPDVDKKCVRITKLDSLVEETGVIPNLIKMDIEGAEFDALRGAEKTISVYKPVLAICLYHKAEDLITIPQYIKSLNQDYRLYLRHFSITPSELVLFAI